MTIQAKPLTILGACSAVLLSSAPASAYYCQYAYQWVCAYGSCSYQYVWACQ